MKVRLANIDAPENKQAFGSRSKQALSDLCFQEGARLETQGRDRDHANLAGLTSCSFREHNSAPAPRGLGEKKYDRTSRAQARVRARARHIGPGVCPALS